MLLCCLLAIGVLPRSAHAQDEFSRYYRAAEQLYQLGNTERALEQLQRAKKYTSTVKQDVDVSLFEGVILTELNRSGEALEAFEAGLLLDAKAELPIKVSPKLKGEFEKVRERVAKASVPSPPKVKVDPPKPPPQKTGDGAVRKPSDGPPAPAAGATAQSGAPPAKPKLEPPVPPAPEPYVPQAPVVEKSRARVPVVPLVLAGVGVTAAGVGTVFGLQSRSNVEEARKAYAGGLPPQSELGAVDARMSDARGQARMANVLFGTAVVAAGGAVVTWLLQSDDTGAAPEGTR
jgi:tetratricopeptide (TPR) repeat protein